MQCFVFNVFVLCMGPRHTASHLSRSHIHNVRIAAPRHTSTRSTVLIDLRCSSHNGGLRTQVSVRGVAHDAVLRRITAYVELLLRRSEAV